MKNVKVKVSLPVKGQETVVTIIELYYSTAREKVIGQSEKVFPAQALS